MSLKLNLESYLFLKFLFLNPLTNQEKETMETKKELVGIVLILDILTHHLSHEPHLGHTVLFHCFNRYQNGFITKVSSPPIRSFCRY